MEVGRVDVHARDAELLLQRVQLLGERVLGLADVDDQLRVRCGDGLAVEVALAAVDLAKDGQIGEVLAEVGELLVRELAGEADHLLGRHREQHLLGHGTGRRDALDLGRDLHLAPERVRDHARRSLVGGSGLRSRRAAARPERHRHRKRRDRRQERSSPHFFSLLDVTKGQSLRNTSVGTQARARSPWSELTSTGRP